MDWGGEDTGPMLLRGVRARTFSIGDFEAFSGGGGMRVGPGMIGKCKIDHLSTVCGHVGEDSGRATEILRWYIFHPASGCSYMVEMRTYFRSSCRDITFNQASSVKPRVLYEVILIG